MPLRAAHAVPGCCGDRVGGTVGERGEGRGRRNLMQLLHIYWYTRQEQNYNTSHLGLGHSRSC